MKIDRLNRWNLTIFCFSNDHLVRTSFVNLKKEKYQSIPATVSEKMACNILDGTSCKMSKLQEETLRIDFYGNSHVWEYN